MHAEAGILKYNPVPEKKKWFSLMHALGICLFILASGLAANRGLAWMINRCLILWAG
jgi:hypothetical protein